MLESSYKTSNPENSDNLPNQFDIGQSGPGSACYNQPWQSSQGNQEGGFT